MTSHTLGMGERGDNHVFTEMDVTLEEDRHQEPGDVTACETAYQGISDTDCTLVTSLSAVKLFTHIF